MVFIDFDGTIVDLWPRYHAVFCSLTNSQVDLPSYKRIKQLYKRDADVAQYFGLELPRDYFPRKAVLLEDPRYLALDKLLLPKHRLLHFMEQTDARILSARRYPENLIWELDHLGLAALHGRTICVSIPKATWAEANVTEQGIIIGDDVKDLNAVTTAALEAVMVQTGLCTGEDFSRTELPHTLVPSLEAYIDTQIHVSHN